MKWSEQMRELQSVDENYNQLVYDVDNNKLYINGKFITDIDSGTVSYNLAKEIKKKYPFFTDENFLLHCVFKAKDGNNTVLDKTSYIIVHDNIIEIWSHDPSIVLKIYHS